MKSSQNKHHCHLCDSQTYTLLHDQGRHEKTVYNYICEQCGFIFVLPRPNLKEIKTLYEENEFSAKERNLIKPDEKKFRQCERAARTRLQLLESKIGEELWSKDKSVLEIGCGTGSFLRLMGACGWEVLGLEPDQVYTEASKERYGIPIKNQLLEEFDSEKPFDLVCSFHVIEHIEDPNAFLAGINRLLVDEGYLYLECPSIDYWYGNANRFFWDVHINTFSQKTLLGFLAKNDFETVFSGWQENNIWAIAKKTTTQKIAISGDNPKRLKKLVALATSKNNSLVSTPLLKKARNRLSRSINIVKNNPKQVTLQVGEELRSRSKVFDSLLSLSPNANQVAVKPVGKSQLKVAHVGLHYNANAGDTLLFPAVRWLHQKHLAPTQYTLIPLHKKVTQETINKINQHDALLIGGGGVLLADTNPNNASGWQWACPIELLQQIKVPIIVFAIGYNRFRGQKDFAPVFQENLSKLVEKSIFFGVRNRGSIEAIKEYLPLELHNKLSFQPCPTTILNRFYPNLPNQEKPEPTLAVNLAFDRHYLRFGKNENEILWGIAQALLLLQEQGWKIKLFTHTKEDKDAHLWFRSQGLFAEEVDLWSVPPSDVIAEYSKVTIAVGMRGHAQMVPFGLGCPILSLISHDKLRYFLEDIEHTEWGLDIKTSNLKDKLALKINDLYQNQNMVQKELLQAQDQLWEITQENLNLLKTALL